MSLLATVLSPPEQYLPNGGRAPGGSPGSAYLAPHQSSGSERAGAVSSPLIPAAFSSGPRMPLHPHMPGHPHLPVGGGSGAGAGGFGPPLMGMLPTGAFGLAGGFPYNNVASPRQVDTTGPYPAGNFYLPFNMLGAAQMPLGLPTLPGEKLMGDAGLMSVDM